MRTIVAETSGGGLGQEIAKDRAQWEACRRWGRGRQIRLVTDAWRDVAGALYEPNTLVAIDLPSLKATGVFWLISEVTYLKTANGTTCELTIMPPPAFNPQPTLLYALPAEISQLPDGLGQP